MRKVGELVRETIESMEIGSFDVAFAATCAGIETTLKKSLEKENLNNGDYLNFIKKYWDLIIFMGLPKALPMPLNVEFGLTKLVHGFNLKTVEDVVQHLVRQTAMMGRLPVQFKFHHGTVFELSGDKILVPVTLVGGLIGIVIMHPANAEGESESVPDKYWMNVSDFKMFISEFWGRMDLGVRVMNFYKS